MATFNPISVLFNPSGGSGSPYIGPDAGRTMTPAQPLGGGQSAPSGGGSSSILGPESIRATGSGPFDQAYRQNLATYAGGNFTRPGGNLAFNPTDPNSLFGAPTGGGSAPLPGIGASLLQQALGGSPFMSQPQPPPTSPSVAPQQDWKQMWKQWLDRFNAQGSMFRSTPA